MSDNTEFEFTKIESNTDFPTWASRDFMANFFHETMKPYHDEVPDIQRSFDYCFADSEYAGGFLMLIHQKEKVYGALLMLNTGMKGYVPENILLFVTIIPDGRGKGIGGKLIKRCFDECEGDVKLHVEYDNPAKRLYERLGMTSDYAEMRLKR